MSCGGGCRCSSDLTSSLVIPICCGSGSKKTEKKKKRKKKTYLNLSGITQIRKVRFQYSAGSCWPPHISSCGGHLTSLAFVWSFLYTFFSLSQFSESWTSFFLMDAFSLWLEFGSRISASLWSLSSILMTLISLRIKYLSKMHVEVNNRNWESTKRQHLERTNIVSCQRTKNCVFNPLNCGIVL